ncbi:hypothetical protein FRC11_010024 [Ceratobasidium sp. 423]|nr:hypothetical protein FRC11_010024 [Ceratobasidium sp. 423]
MSRSRHESHSHINLFTPGLPPQTLTPHAYINLPDKEALVSEFRGKSLTQLRTPALVIDRATFADNCARMHERAAKLGTGFRAHVKTHKTAEGTRLQLKSSAAETNSVVVSTLMEAWGVVHSGLVADRTVNDVSHALLLHPRSFDSFFEDSIRTSGLTGKNSRPPHAPNDPIDLRGSSSANGGSPVPNQAASNLQNELSAVNTAAGHALPKYRTHGLSEPAFVLSVGATPTAHAASGKNVQVPTPLRGAIELHAGNYPMLDSQQLATNLVTDEDVAQRVLAGVVSYYVGRGEGDEAMCDVGAIGMSKDRGPIPGFGKVVNVLRDGEEIGWAPRETGWTLGRISQEHGILTRTNKCAPEEEQDILRLGDVVGKPITTQPDFIVIDMD